MIFNPCYNSVKQPANDPESSPCSLSPLCCRGAPSWDPWDLPCLHWSTSYLFQGSVRDLSPRISSSVLYIAPRIFMWPHCHSVKCCKYKTKMVPATMVLTFYQRKRPVNKYCEDKRLLQVGKSASKVKCEILRTLTPGDWQSGVGKISWRRR